MLRTPHAIDCNIHAGRGFGECDCGARAVRIPQDTVRDRISRQLRIAEFHRQEEKIMPKEVLEWTKYTVLLSVLISLFVGSCIIIWASVS